MSRHAPVGDALRALDGHARTTSWLGARGFLVGSGGVGGPAVNAHLLSAVLDDHRRRRLAATAIEHDNKRVQDAHHARETYRFFRLLLDDDGVWPRVQREQSIGPLAQILFKTLRERAYRDLVGVRASRRVGAALWAKIDAFQTEDLCALSSSKPLDSQHGFGTLDALVLREQQRVLLGRAALIEDVSEQYAFDADLIALRACAARVSEVALPDVKRHHPPHGCRRVRKAPAAFETHTTPPARVLIILLVANCRLDGFHAFAAFATFCSASSSRHRRDERVVRGWLASFCALGGGRFLRHAAAAFIFTAVGRPCL